jgi:glycosyltransferase involved in cell wall biosynthesis
MAVYDKWIADGKPILFSSKFTSLSGFGYQAMKYATSLSRQADVYIKNTSISRFDWTDDFWYLLGKRPKKEIPVLIYDGNLNGQSPASMHGDFPIKGYYTMFETDRIAPSMVEDINSYNFCIVPSTFCKKVFEESGVTVPIFVVPHGIDSEEFAFKEREEKPEFFVFGIYGILTPRKGVHLAIEAFEKAFPYSQFPQVYLHIKSSHYIQYWKEPDDPRVLTYDPIVLSRQNLVKILHNWNCLVHPSMGEGSGLTLVEAISTGMPVIATNFSGMTDYLSEETGYPVNYELIPAFGHAPGLDEHLGHFAKASIDHLVERMREVYSNYPAALEKTRRAARSFSEYLSWNVVGDRLADAVESFIKDYTNDNK